MSVVLSERAEEVATSYAVDRVLSNVASLTEWVSDECLGAKSVYLEYVPSHDPVALSEMVQRADMPTLVALQMYPATAVCAAACHEMRDRWLRYCSDQIDKIAGELAPAVLEDLQ